MNRIEIPDSFLYEFNLDQQIVSNALDNFLSLKKYWHSSETSTNLIKRLKICYLKKDNEPVSVFYDKPLYEEIDKCLQEVSTIHFQNQKLSITDAWWTVAQKGEESIYHYHSNSLFSGIIYFHNSKTPIEFKINDPFVDKWNDIFSKNVAIKPLSYNFNIFPSPGKMYIWRSDIIHRVCIHGEESIRYSFAFNTWLDGETSDAAGGRQKMSIQTNYFKLNE